eukprot:740531-Pelagomonas_calceolata.AAC.8
MSMSVLSRSQPSPSRSSPCLAPPAPMAATVSTSSTPMMPPPPEAPAMADAADPPRASKLAACIWCARCVDASAATHLRPCACVHTCVFCGVCMFLLVLDALICLIRNGGALCCEFASMDAVFRTANTFPASKQREGRLTPCKRTARLCESSSHLDSMHSEHASIDAPPLPLTCTHLAGAGHHLHVPAAALPQAGAGQAATHA